MGWCPKCKNEFIDTISICPKCDITLFNSKEKALQFNFEKDGENIANYDANGNMKPTAKVDNSANDFSGGWSAGSVTSSNDFDNDAFTAALSNAFGLENTNDNENVADTESEILKQRIISAQQFNEEVKKTQKKGVYQRSSDKAEDVKSAVVALLLVGIVGLVCMILIFFNVIPLHLNKFGHYVLPLVMGILFMFLIIFGLLEIKSFKKLKSEASDEDKLDKEIEKWYKESITREIIDKNLFIGEENLPEEEKYFKRYARIQTLLNSKFMNLDNLYSDHICEDIYNYLFEED